MSPRLLFGRLLALGRARRLDRELDGEIQAHLELAERDALAAGLDPAEARRRARLDFGGIDAMKESHRDRRSFRWLEDALQDVRYGLAGLRRERTFTAVAVGVLALGIGANAALFGLIDAMLLKPLGFPDPDRIVEIREAPRPGVTNATSTLDFRDWRSLTRSFAAVAAEQPIAPALTGAGEPVRLPGKDVTADYFAVFGVAPRLGRAFAEADETPGAPRAVVLTHAAWQSAFGSDPAILERRPILDGEPHRVVGVLPPGAFDRDEARIFRALVVPPHRETRDWHWLLVHARLRPGVTVDQARAEMRVLHASLAEVTPVFKRDWVIEVETLQRLLVGSGLRRSLQITLGAVAAVLLLACANVTNLLLARGASRHKEMVLRAALGAGRGRLVRQLLAESATLCLLGGAAGLGLAALLVWSSRPAVATLLPPYAEPVRLDLRVLAFAAVAALGSTLLVGLLPSLRASSVRLSQALNESARGVAGGTSRLRRVIVVAEVAASLVLVCGAMVLVRTLGNLQGLATGVRIENVLTLSADLPAAEYPTPESATQFYDAVVARLQSVPGVERAALTTQLPLLWIRNGEGVRVPAVEKPINVRFKRVDPGYFPSLDVALAVGRGFEPGDREGAEPVLIVNETLAAALGKLAKWTDPVDHTVQLQYPDYTNHTVTRDARIVGVIRSERVGGTPGQPAPPVVYVPLAQAPQASVRLVVGTRSEPTAVTPSLRAAIREVAPNLPLGDVATLREVHRRLYNEPRRTAWVVGAFATVAALLAGLGLYGVLTHSVSQRRREIGIRVALGARSGDVVRQVLANAASLVAFGLGLGFVAVLGLTRVLQGLLFQVSALDPASLSFACAAMLGVGLLAALGPAHRATKLDPVAVLRDEG